MVLYPKSVIRVYLISCRFERTWIIAFPHGVCENYLCLFDYSIG